MRTRDDHTCSSFAFRSAFGPDRGHLTDIAIDPRDARSRYYGTPRRRTGYSAGRFPVNELGYHTRIRRVAARAPPRENREILYTYVSYTRAHEDLWPNANALAMCVSLRARGCV